jgi:hypothetical protein
MTLTEAIQAALAGVSPRALGSSPIVFTLPAKNGGRGAVEVMVKSYADRWSSKMKEYDLRYLMVSVSLVGQCDLRLSFALCPFEDGSKIARTLSPIEVLQHVEPEQIMEKLKAMIAATGDMQLSVGSPRNP